MAGRARDRPHAPVLPRPQKTHRVGKRDREPNRAGLRIDLPIDGDVFDPKAQWLGVNIQSRGRPGKGLQPLDQPLLRSYSGEPHGATVEDVHMNLQTWPPLIGR